MSLFILEFHSRGWHWFFSPGLTLLHSKWKCLVLLNQVFKEFLCLKKRKKFRSTPKISWSKNTNRINRPGNKGRIDFMPVVMVSFPFIHIITKDWWTSTVCWCFPAKGHGMTITIQKSDTMRIWRTSYKEISNLRVRTESKTLQCRSCLAFLILIFFYAACCSQLHNDSKVVVKLLTNIHFITRYKHGRF